MEHEYILSFSSFYKAAYAKDVLEEHGLHSILQKLPLQKLISAHKEIKGAEMTLYRALLDKNGRPETEETGIFCGCRGVFLNLYSIDDPVCSERHPTEKTDGFRRQCM